MKRPPVSSMIYWRFNRKRPDPYFKAKVKRYMGSGLIELESFETKGCSIVDPKEIKWRECP